MKILFVNSYPSWIRVSHDDQASQHLFGIHQQVKRYYSIRGGYFAELKNGDIIRFICCKSVFDRIKVWLLSIRYDVVYDVMNCMGKLSGLIYYLTPSKIIMILHHPPFDKQLSISNANAFVFFSDNLLNIAKASFPKYGHKMFVNKWQPDKEWYKRHVKEESGEYIYDCVDNGRTNRDHNFLLNALRKAGKKAFVFDDMINDPNKICDRPKTYLAEDDVMKILRGSRYIIIPLRGRHKIYGPIGATALLDAMALCKPVICSDNFYLSSDVRKYNKIGFVSPERRYEAPTVARPPQM